MAEKNYEIRSTSGEVLGTFNSKEEADKFIEENGLEQHFYETLPEVTVTAQRPFYATPQFQEVWGSGNPIWGNTRTENYTRAEQRNPSFSQDWDMASNIGEGIHMIAPVLNFSLPSQYIGTINDDRPFITSMLEGNSGVVSKQFSEQNPYLAMLTNMIVDAGVGYGVGRTHRYLQGYHPVGNGVSSQVYVSNNPFKRKYVYKVSSISPEEMSKLKELPRFARTEDMGPWTNERHIYRQETVTPIDRSKLTQFPRLAKTKNYFERLFPGDTQSVYYNPSTGEVIPDFEFGITRDGREVMFDATKFNNLEEYFSMLKKGGRLCSK